MKKLARKETAKINGGIRPDQCFYIDDSGIRRIGCRTQPFFNEDSGTWIYPLKEYDSCTGDL